MSQSLLCSVQQRAAWDSLLLGQLPCLGVVGFSLSSLSDCYSSLFVGGQQWSYFLSPFSLQALNTCLGVRKWWGLEFHHGMIGFLWVLRCFGLSFWAFRCISAKHLPHSFGRSQGFKNPGSSPLWEQRAIEGLLSCLRLVFDSVVVTDVDVLWQKPTGKRTTVYLEIRLIFLLLPSRLLPKRKMHKNQKRAS